MSMHALCCGCEPQSWFFPVTIWVPGDQTCFSGKCLSPGTSKTDSACSPNCSRMAGGIKGMQKENEEVQPSHFSDDMAYAERIP